MLEHRIHVPDEVAAGAPVLVLLHGRGADEADMASVADRLPGDRIVVAPRAPFPGAPWGYGPGWAWYRFLGEDRPEPESFSESLERLDELLSALPDTLPVEPGPLALGGFSQGGTLSLAYALTHPGTVPRVLNFSGFLADHPQVTARPATVEGTRFFWAHGTQDPAIPHALAVRGRAALTEAGADLEARDYPIGHWIAPEELRDAVRWLE